MTKGKKGDVVWDEHAIELVIKMWQGGNSSGQIFERLTSMGYRCTRNSIVGHLYRRGLMGKTSKTGQRAVDRTVPLAVGGVHSTQSDLPTKQVLLETAAPRRGKSVQNFEHVRATVPYQGVHPFQAEHLTLSDLCDREGKGLPRRCHWPTSPFDVETTFCAVPLSQDTKGSYCPVHSFRLVQSTALTDEQRVAIQAQLQPAKEFHTKEPI